MAIQINGKKVIQLGTAKIPVLKGDKGDIGEQGEQGIQGIPGYTPIKGVDYMTSEDRQQIADTVKADITPEITELKNGKVDKKEGYGLSQNDFTNELKAKLDNAGKQEDIDKLKAENQKQAEEIKALDKTLTRAEASGENINIKNSAEYPISNISIDTNIKQDTRNGYNKLKVIGTSQTINGVKVTYNEDNSITLNGTATDNANIPLWGNYGDTDTKFVLSSGDYTLYGKGKTKGFINIFDTSKTLITQIISCNELKNFTTSEDKNVGCIYFHCTKDTTYSNETIYPMLLSGTYNVNTIPPYEQYGSMPSIEFPSEIQTPVGKQSFYAGNKNLFDINKITENFFLDGADVNNTGSSSVTDTSNYIRVYENIPITVSMKYETLLNENGRGSVFYDLNKKPISGQNYIITNIMKKPFTITPSQDGYFRFSYDKNCYDIQVEYEETPTAYTPHQSQIQDLDLTSELLGIIVDKEDGSYFENRYGRYTVTGDENWNLFENGKRIDLYNIVTKCDNSNNQYCNYIKKCDPYALYQHTFFVSDYNIRMYNDWNFTNEDEVKAKFKELYNSGKPLNFVYQLATPTYTKLTDEQQAQWNKIKKMHTYEGVTNIYTINENGISPVINMKYVKSPKVVEENLQAQIDKLKNSIISMGGNV